MSWKIFDSTPKHRYGGIINDRSFSIVKTGKDTWEIETPKIRLRMLQNILRRL